ncbi:MAG: phage terminase large subunit family protein [Planctomycetota bacterium]|nr:phage terminase large subunit family protein [Planctomycetota bacterium]
MSALLQREEILEELEADFWELLEQMDLVQPSKWIEENCIVTEGPRPGPFRFQDGFSWQREIVDELGYLQAPGSGTRDGAVNKCCQSGLTVLMIALCIYRAVVLRRPTLFLEPRDSDANRVAADCDRMIMGSEKVRAEFPGRDARKLRVTRHGTKIYFRYSNSEDEIVSISSQGFIGDEWDRCYRGEDYSSTDMAAKRLDAWPEKLKIAVSTPTYPGGGIDELFESSQQRERFVLCPYCDGAQVPDFESNISWDQSKHSRKLQAKSAWMHCSLCSKRWSRFDRERADNAGYWKAQFPERSILGWTLNACHVVARDPCDLVEDHLKGQTSEVARREDLNQNKARVYLPKGAKIPKAVIEAVITDELKWGIPPADTERLVCGVDVQKSNEPFDYVWETRAYDDEGMCSIIAYGIASGRAEIKEVIEKLWHGRRIDCALMDCGDGAHHIDTVRELANDIEVLSPAFFDHQMKNQPKLSKPSKEFPGTRRVNRELSLNETMGRFHKGETKVTVRVAKNPDWSRENIWKDHYQKLHRKEKKLPDSVTYFWVKQNPVGVDYPFAGALCEVAHSLRPRSYGASSHYGSLSDDEHIDFNKGQNKPSQRGWGRIKNKGKGRWRRS